MRHVFDVEGRVGVCGGGGPYLNRRGFQGADDMKCTLTLVLNEDEERADVIEFEGSGKAILEMLKSATDAVEGTLEVVLRDGPRRPTDCPNCDPLTLYPNATHTEECAFDRFWSAKRANLEFTPQPQSNEGR